MHVDCTSADHVTLCSTNCATRAEPLNAAKQLQAHQHHIWLHGISGCECSLTGQVVVTICNCNSGPCARQVPPKDQRTAYSCNSKADLFCGRHRSVCTAGLVSECLLFRTATDRQQMIMLQPGDLIAPSCNLQRPMEQLSINTWILCCCFEDTSACATHLHQDC